MNDPFESGRGRTSPKYRKNMEKRLCLYPVLGCAQRVTGALMEAELCVPSVEGDGEEGL